MYLILHHTPVYADSFAQDEIERSNKYLHRSILSIHRLRSVICKSILFLYCVSSVAGRICRMHLFRTVTPENRSSMHYSLTSQFEQKPRKHCIVQLPCACNEYLIQ